MSGVLKYGVVVGLLAGLIVGGLHNAVTVPVIEEAIAVEDAREAQEPESEQNGEAAEVSLGAQRVGTAAGMGVLGVILGAVFSGMLVLVRRVTPSWHPLKASLVTGAAGCWAVSVLPFLKYPTNPPGVGETETLLFRQGFQLLFLTLSLLGLAFLYVARVRRTAPEARRKGYTLTGAAYVAFIAIVFFALPSNPDPTTVPTDLLWRFRALSITGHVVLWALIALGMGLVLGRRSRAGQPAQDRTRR